ncbi:MAG: Na+/H+ antiporter NhaA [Bacteroidetes bacterium]|nr:Na+/H+ antiporter NhaA [Bacteroidota bacterium]MBP7398223.1 Na+/H+ antiporter NhaA [Chitinophagales bacterium]MBK7109816.1 Na+/H+ antiporter NhaA [Bacteroidota bacterium]MBK8487447.1 Na+/H+ antiporter NhaA [Bacteroidota bacterium]MBK8682810.1 Na+/H+ antiporter NhaA [Bacteroidota bacterium]
MKRTPIDRVLQPLNNYISKSATSGILLFISALSAIVMANIPATSHMYHNLWEIKFTIGFEPYAISKNLHHWINDGLMSIFFFVVGLELKREIMAGELSNPKDAMLPIIAAVGGMVFPALIYALFNLNTDSSGGWGIPMATDIAFALGILYLLGDRIPTSLKIFLTALAIADDLGAVLVIAFFYSSDISISSLAYGLLFLVILIAGNYMGVRKALFYGIIGIGGVWLAFLLSGVHATIAGVLAALTIPANVKVNERQYVSKLNQLNRQFESADPNNNSLVTKEQFNILEEIVTHTKAALTPLQRLEHGLHPIVAYFVMPIFAFANAGITLSGDVLSSLTSNVALGVMFGLLFGKTIGVLLLSKLAIHFKIASLPTGTNFKMIIGASLLASVGFTMSLFITELAFQNPEYIFEAKLGVLAASTIGGLLGYFYLRKVTAV